MLALALKSIYIKPYLCIKKAEKLLEVTLFWILAQVVFDKGRRFEDNKDLLSQQQITTNHRDQHWASALPALCYALHQFIKPSLKEQGDLN